MAFRSWFPRPLVDRNLNERAASPILTVLYLCGAQCGLMLAVTAFFTWQKPAAIALHDCCRSVSAWIPLLSRYGDLYAGLGRDADFKQIFAIYTSYVIIQVIFLLIIGAVILRCVEFRARNPFGDSVPFLLMAVGIGILLFFVFGSYNIARSYLASPDYLFGLLIYCFVLPSANFILAFATYLRYGIAVHDIARAAYARSDHSSDVTRVREPD